jgi:hypothetical protein
VLTKYPFNGNGCIGKSGMRNIIIMRWDQRQENMEREKTKNNRASLGKIVVENRTKELEGSVRPRAEILS